MTTETRPLSDDDLRSLFRSYPALVSAIVGAASVGIKDAQVISDIFNANSTIIDDIVSLGSGLTTEEVSKRGLLKFILAAQILAKTTAAREGAPQFQLLDIAPLVHGVGGLQ